MKDNFPEERTKYSESSRPGDLKNDLEIGLAYNYNVALNINKAIFSLHYISISVV